MSAALSYRVLFAFEGPSNAIVEVQRLGIQSEDKSKLFYWLLIPLDGREQNEIERLEFVAMGETADGKQSRTFSQGALSFDEHFAEFLGVVYQKMDAASSSNGANMHEQIARYLNSLNKLS